MWTFPTAKYLVYFGSLWSVWFGQFGGVWFGPSSIVIHHHHSSIIHPSSSFIFRNSSSSIFHIYRSSSLSVLKGGQFCIGKINCKNKYTVECCYKNSVFLRAPLILNCFIFSETFWSAGNSLQDKKFNYGTLN